MPTKGFYLVDSLRLESPNNMLPTLAILWWQRRGVCTWRRDLITKWKPENCNYTTSCWTISTTKHASNLKGPSNSNATINLATNKPLEEMHLIHISSLDKVTTGVPHRKWRTRDSRWTPLSAYLPCSTFYTFT